MTDFVVNTNQLRNCAGRISDMQKELDSVAVRLGAMQLGSIIQIKASTALIGAVSDCKWAAAHQSDDLGRLARGMQEIADLYENNENHLSEPKTKSVIEKAQEEEDGNILADVADWFCEIPGVLVDFVGEVTDVFIDGCGEVVTFIQRIFQNISEFDGELLNLRFWAELGLETVIDIGKGIIIGAGVGAAAITIIGATGATLTTAGVGIIVAVGTAVVSWGTDVVYEIITGNEGGITEWISDNIIDGAIELGNDVIETVSDGVEVIWDGIVDIFS